MPLPYMEYFAHPKPSRWSFPWRHAREDTAQISSHLMRLTHRFLPSHPVYVVTGIDPVLNPKNTHWVVSVSINSNALPLVFARKHAPRWLPNIVAFALDIRRAYAPELCAAYDRFERAVMTHLLLEGKGGTWTFSGYLWYSIRKGCNEELPLHLIDGIGNTTSLPIPSADVLALDPQHPLKSLDHLFADAPCTRFDMGGPMLPHLQWTFEVPNSSHERIRKLHALQMLADVSPRAVRA